jgi:hypothetical protein
VVLGGSLNGNPAEVLFAQGDNPNGTSVPLGLAGSAGSGRGLKSQDHDGTAKKSSTKVSAGKENHAPTSNGTPDDFNDNEFNVSNSGCYKFKIRKFKLV